MIFQRIALEVNAKPVGKISSIHSLQTAAVTESVYIDFSHSGRDRDLAKLNTTIKRMLTDIACVWRQVHMPQLFAAGKYGFPNSGYAIRQCYGG